VFFLLLIWLACARLLVFGTAVVRREDLMCLESKAEAFTAVGLIRREPRDLL
jgi:hypothetical protein